MAGLAAHQWTKWCKVVSVITGSLLLKTVGASNETRRITLWVKSTLSLAMSKLGTQMNLKSWAIDARLWQEVPVYLTTTTVTRVSRKGEAYPTV